MPDRIAGVAVRSFRGATQPLKVMLDPGKPLVVVWGGNGSGKSTLIDAIDVVCNQTAGSLGDRSSTGRRAHLPSLGASADDVAVWVRAGGCTWRASLSGRTISVEGPGTPPAVRILRRHQLLQLIEAAPSARYEALRRFVDVAGVERSEKALRETHSEASRRLEEEVRRREDAGEEVARLWAAEGSPGAPAWTAAEWAAAQASADTAAQQRAAAALEALVSGLDQVLRATVGLEQARADYEKCETDLAQLDAEADARPQVGADAELAGLLERAQQYLSSHSATAGCPLCGSAADGPELCRQLGVRLAQMTHLLELRVRREGAARRRDAAVMVLDQRRAEVELAHQALAACSCPPELWDIPDLDLPCAPEGGDLGALAGCPGELPRIRDGLARARDEIRASIARFNAVRQIHESLLGAEARIRAAHDAVQRLWDAQEIVRSRRIAFTQSMLEGVTSECNSLYSRIHPGESLGDIRLFLDEKRRASLNQTGSFQGREDLPPQAYYSEAHLDTLGLCLFLALAKAAGPGSVIVALDDVFTTTDERHLSRVADLLEEEATTFSQIILTAHHPFWRDRYGHGQAAGVAQYLALSEWSLAGGIRLVAEDHLAAPHQSVL